MEIKSVSMLVTNNGYCVKVMLAEEPPVVFFTDKEMNHRTWKGTEKNPDLLLDQREFWRMRREWKLEEVPLSEDELQKAVQIAEEVYKDPYYGFDEVWRRKTKTTLYDLKRRKGTDVAVRYIDDSTPATLGNLSALQKLKEKMG